MNGVAQVCVRKERNCETLTALTVHLGAEAGERWVRLPKLLSKVIKVN